MSEPDGEDKIGLLSTYGTGHRNEFGFQSKRDGNIIEGFDQKTDKI